MIGIPNLLKNTARWYPSSWLRRGMLSTSPIQRVRALILFMYMLFPCYPVAAALLVQMVDSGHYKVTVDLNDPDIYRGWEVSTRNNDDSTIIPTYWGRGSTGVNMPVASYDCYQTSIFPPDAFTNEHHKDHERAVRTVFTKLDACTFPYRPEGSKVPSWQNLKLYVGVSSGKYRTSIDLGPGSLEMEPNHCDITIDTMTFGHVRPNTTPIVTTDLHVSCSRDANIKVTTNGGRNFKDPASGTIISFLDPPKFALRTCSENCVVPIEGRMEKAPKKSGAYKWFVPVLVEYL